MSHSVKFECVEHPWNGAVIIFDDGQVKLYRQRLNPDRPVLVQIEGKEPNHEQVEMCRHLWSRLHQEMDFSAATFCLTMLPYSRQILAPIVENIPA
jgi:hypothetical protein